jgi:hypothetical protein
MQLHHSLSIGSLVETLIPRIKDADELRPTHRPAEVPFQESVRHSEAKEITIYYDDG